MTWINETGWSNPGGDTQGKFGLGCASESLQNLTLLDCETARIFAYSSTRDRHIKYIYKKKKYARAVKQKVWNEAENRERNWGETQKNRPHKPFGRVRLARLARQPRPQGAFP